MDQEPDLIKERMEETRVSLTDKIETLENTLKETVQNTLSTASNVVEDVEETVENVKDSVEESAEAIKETVTDTLQSIKDTVAGAFDVTGHVQRHPWAMLGGAVVVGFLGGRLLLGTRERRWRDRRRREVMETFSAPGRAGPPPPAPPAPERTYTSAARAEEKPREEEGPSWMQQLTSTFGDELSKLKGLALGATFGVIRDMVTASAPEQVRSQLADVIDNFTTKAGGKPIQGPLVEPDGHNGHQRGGDHGQRHETEMARPMGSAQGPCETGLG